ncbi:ferritin-like domain-containing protein [Crenalkalicoccus roseus]|uniref:ferritin-like domain-containing protein n=1 Tax=Crenalkalicoccus roseus TaxID=1485588 RepID=UPI0010822453|nr:ferritin-like domain-containing protein [Crenalkalicoccus roseus]
MATSFKDIYVTGLTNAHALETQAIQLLQRQVERLENYPAMAERIRQHIEESRRQASRLEEILQRLGTSHSTLKDIGAGFLGNMAALAHTPAQDEVVKNTFANFAFEHYEIATYRALLEMAQAAGDGSAPTALKESLNEEIRMAEWIDQHLPETIRTYMQLTASGQKAGV